jgi:hypothetical protein
MPPRIIAKRQNLYFYILTTIHEGVELKAQNVAGPNGE